MNLIDAPVVQAIIFSFQLSLKFIVGTRASWRVIVHVCQAVLHYAILVDLCKFFSLQYFWMGRLEDVQVSQYF